MSKDFVVNFETEGSDALTLPSSFVTCINFTQWDVDDTRIYSRTHSSGWTISAQLCCDGIVWVNDFKASHPQYGRVWGDFEHRVYASSKRAYNHFYKNHPPEAWDYNDI